MSAAVYANLTQKQKKLLSDLSLSNEYTVEITLPPDFASFLTNPPKPMGKEKPGLGLSIDVFQLSLLCSDASLPGSTFATAEVKDNFLGVTQEFAHTRLYTDIDLTFYVDRQYKVLELFQGWNDYISGGAGGQVAQNSYDRGFYRRFRYPDSYKTQINIAKLERDYGLPGKKYYSRTYTLINAFPKSVAAVPIAYGPADILKITTTFSYDRYILQRLEESVGNTGATESPASEPNPANTSRTSGRPINGRKTQLEILERRGTITPVQQTELNQLRNQ